MIDFLFAASNNGDWSAFPFGPGFTGSWLLAICKFLFIGLILALIMVVLRWLFGPKGFLRDKELDREAAGERKSRQEAGKILDQRLARGEISPEEYARRKKALKR